MAIALFHHFIVTFANSDLSVIANPIAAPTAALKEGKANRVYQIIESPRRHWNIFENGRPIILTAQQQQRLLALLTELELPPNPAIVPALAGQEGTWTSLELQQSSQQIVYQWWIHAPEEWSRLETLTCYVGQISKVAREKGRQQQQSISQVPSSIHYRIDFKATKNGYR
jgi:hypothetical protein